MRIGWSCTSFGGGLLMFGAAALAQTPVPAAAPSPVSSAARASSTPASSASASSTPATSTPVSSQPPQPAPRPSRYNPTLAKGHAAMVARNYAGASEAYRAAVAADPRDALALYFLGEAGVAAGNFAEAEAAFSRGLAAAGAHDDVHARLLFVWADLRERQGKWADAQRAWASYGEFASAHPDVKSYAVTAAERATTIGTHVDLETKYAAVKQRAEQRAKDAGPPAAASSAEPPGASARPVSNPGAAQKK